MHIKIRGARAMLYRSSWVHGLKVTVLDRAALTAAVAVDCTTVGTTIRVLCEATLSLTCTVDGSAISLLILVLDRSALDGATGLMPEIPGVDANSTFRALAHRRLFHLTHARANGVLTAQTLSGRSPDWQILTKH